jgi:hypothetical protein
MPQMHLYVPEEVASALKARARARGQSVSSYLADVVSREVGTDWPAGFFTEVAGGWKGKPLRRPRQRRSERRDRL